MIVVGLVKYLSEVCHVLIEPGEYPYFVGIHLFFFIPENVSGSYHDLLTNHKSGRDGVIHSRVGFPAAEDERVLAIRQIPHIRDTVPGASGNDLVRRHLSALSDRAGHGFIRFHPVGIRRLEIVSSAYGIVL